MGWPELRRNLQGVVVTTFAEREADGTPSWSYLRDGVAVVDELEAVQREEHAEIDLGLEATASSTLPELHVRLEDLPAGGANRRTDRVQNAAGERFRFEDEQPDGEGIVRLVLKEVDET